MRYSYTVLSDAIKFPKTPRLAEVLRQDIPPEWKKAHAVVEEKADGANVGVFFEDGELRLQSRGHVLRGGAEERQFSAFHGWAASRLDQLREALGEAYVLYGEWCFAKNKSYYDSLPDLLLGLDVLNRVDGTFLGTAKRYEVFAACLVTPIARLWEGPYRKAPPIASLIGRSKYKTDSWRQALEEESALAGIRPHQVWDETDDSDDAEGVYVRVEIGDKVVGRIKLHREGYTKVRSDHWRERPLVRNRTR